MDGRLTSTPGDNLAEFAGKLCYDSLHRLKSRTTPEYHAHLLDMRHGSVYAHLVETFEIPWSPAPIEAATKVTILAALAGRPGVWISEITADKVRFSVSLRALQEWNQHGVAGDVAGATARNLVERMVSLLRPRFPLALGRCRPLQQPYRWRTNAYQTRPVHDSEKWASLYVEGVSRSLLQELVRHSYQANPSVRSTRYVDEQDSHYVLPPAVDAFDSRLRVTLLDAVSDVNAEARRAYKKVYGALTSGGVDQKTARGAARSCLPEGLETKLVYSLSRAQAKHILAMRLNQDSGAADPEIVRLAGLMRTALIPVWGDCAAVTTKEQDPDPAHAGEVAET